MREYTKWALQEIISGFEFEHLASECMFSIGYEKIQIRGGAQDGGADALIYYDGKSKKGEKIRFAYSTQKKWKSKFIQDINKISRESYIKYFIFCSTQEISGKNKEELALKFKKQYNVIIYDIDQFVVWLDNTNWGKTLKQKYGLIQNLSYSNDFEENLNLSHPLNPAIFESFAKNYCNNIINEKRYSIWLKSFLIRKINVHTLAAEQRIENNITELIKLDGNYLILGDAGLGKTCVLEFLTAYCSKLSKSDNIYFPIHVNLSEIGKYNLFDLIKNEIQIYIPNILPNELVSLLKNEKIVFLLDALNEIEDKYISEFKTNLRKLHKFLPMSSIIITSRSYKQELQIPLFLVELLPISEEQSQKLVTQKIKNKQDIFIEWNNLNQHVKELLKNPFYASVASEIWEESKSFNSTELLSYFIKIKIKEIVSQGFSSEIILKILESLSYNCCLLRKNSFDIDFIIRISKGLNIHNQIDVFGGILKILVSAGLLKELRFTYSFRHQIFQYYFAANFLLQLYKENRDIIPILEQTYMNGFGVSYTLYYLWEEIAPILCDLCDDPDQLILLLLDKIEILAAFCIGDSTRRSEEVVKTAIKKFSKSLNSHTIFCLGATKSTLALPSLLLAFKEKEDRFYFFYDCSGMTDQPNYVYSTKALLELPKKEVEREMNKLLKSKNKTFSSRAEYFFSCFKRSGVNYTINTPANEKRSETISLEKCKLKIQNASSEQLDEITVKAIKDIESIGTLKAEKILIELLSHKNRDIRREAAKSLGNLGSQAAIQEIVNIYLNVNTRRGCLWYWLDLLIALDKIGTSRVSNAFARLLVSESFENFFKEDEKFHDENNILFNIITKYGDLITLHILENNNVPVIIRPFVKKACEKIRFLLSITYPSI